MDANDEVEVRLRFDGRWVSGFAFVSESAAVGLDRRYVLRRRSDGAVLPGLFTPDEVRRSR